MVVSSTELLPRFALLNEGKPHIHPDQNREHHERQQRGPLQEEAEHHQDEADILWMSEMGIDPGSGEHLTALVASNSTLATLGRNLGRSTSLLRQSSVHEAREYREVLDEIAHVVRNHLALAATVLADLQPRQGRPAPTRPLLA